MAQNGDPSLDAATNWGDPLAAAQAGEAGPVYGIDLPTYAALMTRLASGQPRGLVLSGASLDERTWLEVEKTWALRLAKAAQRGDTSTILEFERGVAAAQQNCPAPDPSRSMADYAAMSAAIEKGASPIEVCAHFEMKLTEFFELQQAWTRRIIADPNLARAFRELVASANATSRN